MDDFRLKVFIAAARTLSFTRTAEQLCISQPAVSKHIGELENRYRIQLFNRRGSRPDGTRHAGGALVAVVIQHRGAGWDGRRGRGCRTPFCP